MNFCPISYAECGNNLYSTAGLRKLSRNLKDLKLFPYTCTEQINEAVNRASKISIQGVQPKLSSRLNIKNEQFEIADHKGKFILKPQNPYYKELPQNEDVTMRLASSAGLETPLHGMIYSKDNSLTYFIKRFDRTVRNNKFAVEDFAQLSGKTRDTKYESSMEQVAEVVDTYCTFPQIEKIKLFRLAVFNFLAGNEDAHLKNFSLITVDSVVKLSPCYDLVNSKIVSGSEEEMALPLDGKKRNITRTNLVDYYGNQRLGLNNNIIEEVLAGFYSVFSKWIELINISFLSAEMKSAYIDVLNERIGRMK